MLTSLLLIHILLHKRITMLFLYLHGKSIFLWVPDREGERKGCVQEQQCLIKGFSCCFASLWVEQTIEPSPPPWWFHKLIAYYVARQGEITVFFPLFGSLFFHIFENNLRQFPVAQISCLNLTLFKKCRAHIWRKTHRFLNIQKVLNKAIQAIMHIRGIQLFFLVTLLQLRNYCLEI